MYQSQIRVPCLFVFFFLDLPMANTTPIFFYVSMNDIFIVFLLSVTNI